jgi:hypothetical protein
LAIYFIIEEVFKKMNRFFTKNQEEFADGMGVISFFLIFLPLYYFEINFVFSFLLAFSICFVISYFIKANEAEDLNKAVENFENS